MMNLSWGEDDSKPNFGLSGKNEQFCPTSNSKNKSYACGFSQQPRGLIYNDRDSASKNRRVTASALPVYGANKPCSLQQQTIVSRGEKIIPGQSLSINKPPPQQVIAKTNTASTPSHSMNFSKSSGVVSKKDQSFNQLVIEKKISSSSSSSMLVGKIVLPTKEKPKEESKEKSGRSRGFEASDVTDLVSGDEEFQPNQKKAKFISPKQTKANTIKQIEQTRHEHVIVKDIFMNQKEVFVGNQGELSIRFDGALRAVRLARTVKKRKDCSIFENIYFKDIKEIVLFRESSSNVPNFLQIIVANAFNSTSNEILDLCDENVDPLSTRYLVTMSAESIQSAIGLMKHHSHLKASVRSANSIDEIAECLHPLLLREDLDVNFLISQLAEEMPQMDASSKQLPRRSSRRRSGGIGLLTQQTDPDDHLTYMTYPIEFGAQDVITLSRGDLKRFADREYFNDNLIDLKVKYMIFNLPLEKKCKVYAFSCLFYPKLKELRDFRKAHELISRWTKNVDLFSMDFIFIPINYSLHWSLCAVVRPLQWLIRNYCKDAIELRESMEEMKSASEDDSSSNDDGCLLFLDSLNMHDMKTVHRDVSNYLSNEWKSKHLKRIDQYKATSTSSTAEGAAAAAAAAAQNGSPSTSGIYSSSQRRAIDAILADKVNLNDGENIFKEIRCVKCKVPIQENGFDCGVFVIKFVETLLEVFPTSRESDIDDKMRSQLHGKWFTQQDITEERKTFRQLLAKIEVEWKQSREKLKSEGVLTEVSISQGDLEKESPVSQERLKQLHYEASGYDEDDEAAAEEAADVHPQHHSISTECETLIDEKESYLDDIKNDELANRKVDYRDYGSEDFGCMKGRRAPLEDADPMPIMDVYKASGVAEEETYVEFDELLLDTEYNSTIADDSSHTVVDGKATLDFFSEIVGEDALSD